MHLLPENLKATLKRSAVQAATFLVLAMTAQLAPAAQKAKPLATATESTARSVYGLASPSIIVVKSQSSAGTMQGSGVAFKHGCAELLPGAKPPRIECIPASTWFVTNAHVVRDLRTVSVFVNGMESSAEVKFRDRDTDIALLWADGLVVPKATISPDIAALQPGDDTFAIGAPKGLDKSISQGIVSAIRATPSRTLIQTSTAISPGSSGGGLFDRQGRLIGVTTLKIAGGEGLNFAVSAADLENWSDALQAAKVLYVSTNSSAKEPTHDAFVRWLFERRAGSTLRRFEEFNAGWDASLKSASLKSSAFDFSAQMASDQALRAEFFRDLRASHGTAPAPGAAGGQSTSVINLRCTIKGDRGQLVGVYPFAVDLIGRTVNKHPANITDDMIEWKPGEQTFRIDRATGLLMDPRGGQSVGSCEKVEGRAF